MKVRWVDPPVNIVYLKPDGSAAPADSYPLADDAVSFTLYADGSLESYRNLGGDGSFTWFKFAQAAPGHSKVFGLNSEYTHGDLVFAETMTHEVVDGVEVLNHKVQTFAGGNLTSYEFSYGTPESSSVFLSGSYDSGTGISSVSLTSLDHPTPIINTAPGFINGLNGLTAGLISDNGAVLIGNDGSTLIGNDGSTLIGNDGSTLNQLDVAGLIGNDGSTLIGNDGSTLINLGGGGNSIVGPAYSLQNGRLIGNDGSTLLGTDGASLAANAMASFRGYSAYTLSSFDVDEPAPVDSLSADQGTTGRLDLFGGLEGELEQAGDRDWVKVELSAGETYVITADGASSGDGTLNNPHVRLFDANGTLLGEDADSGAGSNSRLVFTATADGSYFVEASAENDAGVGSYEIGVHAQATAFVKDGPTIESLTGAGFFSETSITALSGGGFAIGFTARIDEQRPFPYNQSYHAHVELIDAEGQVVDLDPRAAFSTFSIFRGGDYNNLPSATQVIATDEGGYSVIVPNVYPIETGMIYRAVVAQGSMFGLGPANPLTPDSTPGFKTYGTYGVDIATLSNGEYIASMGGDGIQGTPTTGNMVQISINGGLPITIDTSTGVNANGQRTSVSALGSGAVVVWTDAAADPSGSDGAATGVLGAIVDADGTLLHTFEVNQTQERAQFIDSAQAVAELADGGFVVAWTANEDDPNHAVPYTDSFFRVFNADGTARSSEMLLGNNQATGQGRPCVVGLPAGGFAIAWSDGGTIRLQQFDDLGMEVGAETVVGFGGGQSLTLAPDGKLAISYATPGQLHVQLMEPNHGPSDVTLSSNTIAENVKNAPSLVIGELAVVDENGSDTFTYELVDSAGGTFRLEGTQIHWNRFDKAPDFEVQSSYEIKVKVTDSAQASFVKTFTIDVTDVNEPVIGLKGDDFAYVAENLPAGTVVAVLAGNDPDKGETFEYQIVGGADGPFAIVGNELRLTQPLDYEDASARYLSLQVKDSAGHTVTKDFTVFVEGVDDAAPTDIQLYGNQIDEDIEPGTAVASIYGFDPDTFAGLEYEVAGANANLFEIRQDSGSMWLFTTGTLDHETMPTVDVTIRVSDGGGRSLEKTFTLDVGNINDLPVITTGSEFSVREGTQQIVKLAAADADGDQIFWRVAPSEGNFGDVFAFDVDSQGYLTLDPAVGVDSPWDTDQDGVYHFRIMANDGTDEVAQEMTVTVVGGNADPVIDGGLNTLVKLKENKALVKTIDATDADGDDLAFSISGGPDSDLFEIKSVKGKAQLVFKDAPDFENPGDVGGNNSYNVIIRADDGAGGTADQAVAVAVQNVKGISFPGTKGVDVMAGTEEEDDLSGADKNDKLDGKGGDDILNGGLGKDRLTGGAGRDIFVFDTKPAKNNTDSILDFSAADDQFHLDHEVFAKIGKEGFLSKTAFVINDTGLVGEKTDRIVYDSSTGELLFDADGSEKKSDTVVFAMLDKGLELSFRDFEII